MKWMIIHILAQPEIATRIREEIKPYIEVSKPYSIGAFSETPKLTISHDGLAKACPLLRAAFFETLRLCNQPWSVRQLSKDISISTGKSGDTQAPNSYGLKNGEYITVPHDLHMLDPAYFPDPHTFKPDRFLETAEDGSVSVNIGSIRPFGGGDYPRPFFNHSIY
jgi:cytochrome P450